MPRPFGGGAFLTEAARLALAPRVFVDLAATPTPLTPADNLTMENHAMDAQPYHQHASPHPDFIPHLGRAAGPPLDVVAAVVREQLANSTCEPGEHTPIRQPDEPLCGPPEYSPPEHDDFSTIVTELPEDCPPCRPDEPLHWFAGDPSRLATLQGELGNLRCTLPDPDIDDQIIVATEDRRGEVQAYLNTRRERDALRRRGLTLELEAELWGLIHGQDYAQEHPSLLDQRVRTARWSALRVRDSLRRLKQVRAGSGDVWQQIYRLEEAEARETCMPTPSICLDVASAHDELMRSDSVFAVHSGVLNDALFIDVWVRGIVMRESYGGTSHPSIPLPPAALRLRYTRDTPVPRPRFLSPALHEGYSESMLSHPHWISEDSPCLGDFSAPIYNAAIDGDIVGTVYGYLEFLRQYNADDSAGKYYYKWQEEPDEISEWSEFFERTVSELSGCDSMQLDCDPSKFPTIDDFPDYEEPEPACDNCGIRESDCECSECDTCGRTLHSGEECECTDDEEY